MTTSRKRLQELRQQAKELEEKIDQLEEQLNNAQPTTGLLGRWATNRDGKQVLIIVDRPMGGWVETAYVNPDGTTRETAEQLDDLTFPDQTTRPQDTPETVTTEEEYEALPEGSVIVSRGGSPWTRGVYGWTSGGSSSTTAELAGTTRRVLRRGWWGE